MHYNLKLNVSLLVCLSACLCVFTFSCCTGPAQQHPVFAQFTYLLLSFFSFAISFPTCLGKQQTLRLSTLINCAVVEHQNLNTEGSIHILREKTTIKQADRTGQQCTLSVEVCHREWNGRFSKPPPPPPSLAVVFVILMWAQELDGKLCDKLIKARATLFPCASVPVCACVCWPLPTRKVNVKQISSYRCPPLFLPFSIAQLWPQLNSMLQYKWFNFPCNYLHL